MYTSLKKLSNILNLKQEGTSRQERYMQALHASEKLMDNRNIQEMIAYMQRFSKNLLFVDPEKDQLDFNVSWEHYFKNDILFLIANISTKNVEEIKNIYEDLYKIFEQNKTVENFLELLEFTYSRFKKIDSWYKASYSDNLLRQDFTLYIRSYLQNELEVIREMLMYSLNQVNDRKRIDMFRNDFLNLDDIWNLQDKENISLREKIFAGSDDQDKLSNASLLLRKTFDTLFHATETIVNKCSTYFAEASQLKQHYHHDHNPHVALIIAFLKLYDYARKELNRIPERHLDFYYRDILRIKEKEAIPDQTFVVFNLAKGFDSGMIKKGTQLSAGKDKQNKELIYETEKDIVVNKSQVNSLHSIYIDRNANQEVLNYFQEILSHNIGHVTLNAQSPGFKIFGEPKISATAGIGFAISSTQLYLAKGERKVIITFESPVQIEQCNKTQDSQPVEFFDTTIIKLLLTGEKGWLDSDVAKNEIHIDSLKKTTANSIELNFTISIRQEQAITAYSKKLHGGGFNTISPVLQCILKYPTAQNEDQPPEKIKCLLDQICVLQNLRIAGVKIMVHVGGIQPTPVFNGVRDLMLENDESVLDTKKPFFPFTSVPKVGSSFYIGCKDFFYKDIQDLYINMEWILPDNFRAYYQRYLSPYDVNKFMASFSILKGKEWKKISDIAIIDVNLSDPRFRSIRLSLKKLKQNISALPAGEIPGFDDLKKDGTLRLKLNYPDFGHGIYPQLITAAVMEGARDKSGGVDYYKIIRQQLNDSVISIKYPDDIRLRTGKARVIYDILEARTLVINARTMMINALSDIILKYNIDNLITRNPGDTDAADSDDDTPGRMLVNDTNLIDRFLGIFRKIGIVDKSVHYDKDDDELDEVADNINKKISKRADFIMPSDDELVSLIINETESAINKAVSIIVDEVLALKRQGAVDPTLVGNIIENEFKEVNKVINDMIAKKIAVHLSVNELPPPPYTPLINNLSASYSSAKDLSATDGDKFFHIAPAGILERGILNTETQTSETGMETFVTNRIFPDRLISSDINYQGMFFIGVSDVTPDQNLSLLFQLAEDPKSNDKKPPVIHWFYLQDNFWIKLNNDNIISDSSHGLQTTGIIEFSIPAHVNNESVLFNVESLYWICAAVENDTDAFPNLIDVKSQAVLVTFKDYKNNPLHLALPLEAEKIKTLIDDIPHIKKISQPVSSFNGKLKENDREYYTRVSELLRHKSRAINNWDYERLVLEEFPSFYKVKCLNNYYNGNFAIGHVTVVPIADFRNKKFVGSNMLLPKINYLELRNIEKSLSVKSSPFVKIHAINPALEHVLVTCKVKFLSYANKGFYLKKLDEDLLDFLTPWASGDADTVSFSAKIYASSIINFIDSQEYVDYVVNLVIEQYTVLDNGEKVFVRNQEQLTSLVETELKSGHSILVSAPKHNIQLVE